MGQHIPWHVEELSCCRLKKNPTMVAKSQHIPAHMELVTARYRRMIKHVDEHEAIGFRYSYP